MDRSTVIAKLREHAPELNAAGIVHLGVHGSVARGDATPSSDVDLIAELDQTKRLSLIGRVHLENRLTDILGVKADLADGAMLRPEVLERSAAGVDPCLLGHRLKAGSTTLWTRLR